MAHAPIPEPVFLTTTQIMHRGEDDPSATGFFLNSEDSTYLVTNAHALVKNYPASGNMDAYEAIQRNPPTIFYWKRDTDDESATVRESLDLSEDSVRWTLYPGSADIAVIKISQTLPSIEEKYEDWTMNSSFAITKEYTLHTKKLRSESAFILTYPGDVYDRENRLPIRRNALIASAFEVPFNGEPKFLTDARMDPGTSGSPVFVSSENVLEQHGAHPRNRYGIPYLVGIHSGNYPIKQSSEMRGREYSDLNETWYYHCPFGAISWLEDMEHPD